jgi:NADPH:quinone reductase-like Zn-dependent oxidoreductase
MTTSNSDIKAIVHDPKNHLLRLTSQREPKPSASQYLVRVYAVGITKGELQWPEPCSLPTPIPGFDVAGIVITAPSYSSKFQAGDKVYALTAFDRPANARNLTVIEEEEIARMPNTLSFVEAAAVPMSALTAREALFDKGGLTYEANSATNKDRSLLVIGASGAVGTWAIQIAKWAGVGRVIGVCGSNNVDFVKTLGATDVIDYRKTSLREWIGIHGEDSKFELVLDGVGGETLGEAWTAVKSNGQLLSIVQPVDSSRPAVGVSASVKGTFFIVQPSGHRLNTITELIEEKSYRAVVDGVYELDDFEKAFGRAGSGHAKGKVLLKLS